MGRKIIMVDNKKSIDELFLCIKRKDKLTEFKKAFGLNNINTEEYLVKFVANFYKAPIVNYKGYINGSKNLCSEVIAKTLVSEDLVKEWGKLKPVRPNHFDTDHTPTQTELSITNRKEEILAKLLFYQRGVKDLGYIFDYQTPLKKTKDDSYGKIDLLGYNSKDKCYSIIELKYRPSGSEETLLRCVLEAYTYYKLFDLNQIESAQDHNGITELRALKDYKHTKNAELVILFDEKSCIVDDGGAETNLMLRIVPKDASNPHYPTKTVESQQYKECKELIDSSKHKELQTLCEEILAQEPHLKQIRFAVLRVETVDESPSIERSYRAETLLTIPNKG